ncbi:MAG: Flp pilus assembly protein CpaB [Pirellulaceae bacterium]
MQAKTMILIVIAVGCGLVATIGISQMVDRKGKESEDETVQLFVAAVSININDKINSQNVRLETWPRDRVPEGSITDLEDLQHRYARQRLFPGEPIMAAKLMDTNSGSASILIPPGHRVCPIKVQGSHNSVANLINPGDRVDVLVFLRATTGIDFTGTKTFLHNITVFAIDQKTARDEDTDDTPQNAHTVSLIVTPKQAEKLTLASELGSLRLVMRHPGEVDDDSETNQEGTSIHALIYGTEENDPQDPVHSNELRSSLVDSYDLEPADSPRNGLFSMLPWNRGSAEDTDATEDEDEDVEHRIFVHGQRGVRVFEFHVGQERPVERVVGEPAADPFSESSDINGGSDFSDQPGFDDFSTDADDTDDADEDDG